MRGYVFWQFVKIFIFCQVFLNCIYSLYWNLRIRHFVQALFILLRNDVLVNSIIFNFILSSWNLFSYFLILISLLRKRNQNFRSFIDLIFRNFFALHLFEFFFRISNNICFFFIVKCSFTLKYKYKVTSNKKLKTKKGKVFFLNFLLFFFDL